MRKEKDGKRGRKKKIIHVLDASAFVKPEGLNLSEEICVTTHDVMEELKSLQAKITFDIFIKGGMDVLYPDGECIREAMERAREIGGKLSDADLSVVALALYFKKRGKEVAVVSDDYAVQNLCVSLGIKFRSVGARGITHSIKWVKKCAHCNLRVDTDENICPRCGLSDFRWVPAEKNKLRRKN